MARRCAAALSCGVASGRPEFLNALPRVRARRRSRAKKNGKEGFPLSRENRTERLLQCDELLARNVCSGVAAARWVEAHHTGFIRTERALTSRSHRDRNGRGFKRGERVGCSSCTARTGRR